MTHINIIQESALTLAKEDSITINNNRMNNYPSFKSDFMSNSDHFNMFYHKLYHLYHKLYNSLRYPYFYHIANTTLESVREKPRDRHTNLTKIN